MTLHARIPVLEIEGLATCPICGAEPVVQQITTSVRIVCSAKRPKRHVAEVLAATAAEAAEVWSKGPVAVWRLS